LLYCKTRERIIALKAFQMTEEENSISFIMKNHDEPRASDARLLPAHCTIPTDAATKTNESTPEEHHDQHHHNEAKLSHSKTEQVAAPKGLLVPAVTSRNKKKHINMAVSVTAGRWTPDEHEAFLRGLECYGREWKRVAQHIPTRTSSQVRSHAQKYFSKSTFGVDSLRNAHTTDSSAVQANVERILQNPRQVQKQVAETMDALRARYRALQQRLLESDVNHHNSDSMQSQEQVAVHVLQGKLPKDLTESHDLAENEEPPRKRAKRRDNVE
jgi:SHAQKYF class myb-like DNA-binding protein